MRMHEKTPRKYIGMRYARRHTSACIFKWQGQYHIGPGEKTKQMKPMGTDGDGARGSGRRIYERLRPYFRPRKKDRGFWGRLGTHCKNLGAASGRDSLGGEKKTTRQGYSRQTLSKIIDLRIRKGGGDVRLGGPCPPGFSTAVSMLAYEGGSGIGLRERRTESLSQGDDVGRFG